MSGEAGASHISVNYEIFLGSGIREAILPSPHLSIGDYFERAGKPYEERLKKAAPQIDQIFIEAIEVKKLPIVEYKSSYEWIYGVIIEDGQKNKGNPMAEAEEKHGRDYFKKGKPALVRFDGIVKNLENFKVTIAINSQVKRTDLDCLTDEIKKILSK